MTRDARLRIGNILLPLLTAQALSVAALSEASQRPPEQVEETLLALCAEGIVQLHPGSPAVFTVAAAYDLGFAAAA